VGTCMIRFNRQSRVVVWKRSLEGRGGEEEVLFNDKGAPKFLPGTGQGLVVGSCPCPSWQRGTPYQHTTTETMTCASEVSQSPQTQRGTYLQSFSWHHLLLSSFFFVCGVLTSSNRSVVKFKFSRAHDTSLSSNNAGISLFEPFVEELFSLAAFSATHLRMRPRPPPHSTPLPYQTAAP
jgi:hypothetical protein